MPVEIGGVVSISIPREKTPKRARELSAYLFIGGQLQKLKSTLRNEHNQTNESFSLVNV